MREAENRHIDRGVENEPSRRRAARQETSLGVLKRVYGIRAVFKCKGQRPGLNAVLAGVSPLVVVLPTAGGKSLLFFRPIIKRVGVTVSIPRLIALMDDMMRRSVLSRKLSIFRFD